ncbi:gastrula zinc finger protein XlCGF57.1-like isoform X2 [Achroia grisella]|uniref:gastrula zinc finger protein XlCGF57.1-like isoform X2 n=1 Tax=Achroia grisella TaxID=688607 RepID=UPI0027D2F500|nr:gastrula zinc finger protein XlCGF57.1-like isoform X2 [Achroia grisella]
MANAKSRPKALKSASTKPKGRKPKGVTKNSVEQIMKGHSNGKSVTNDKMQLLLRKGSLMKEMIVSETPKKLEVSLTNRLMSRSGRIRKKSKDHLKLLDNILKSELMIEDIKAKQRTSGANNNNDSETSDQNDTLVSSDNCTQSNNITVESNKKQKKNIGCKSKIQDNKSSKNHQSITNDLIPTIQVFQCDHCDKIFNTKSAIGRHIPTHMNLKQHKCNYCSRKYRQKSTLRAHIKQQHLNVISASEPMPQYEMCHICDRRFLSQEILSEHIATHISNDNFLKCIYCDKKFSNHVILVQHEKQHLVDGGFQLSVHVKKHVKVKEYICQYCGKEFLRMNSMRRHVQVCHAGFRIQCPICKKNLKGHLSEHMRVHENKRPHVCTRCGQRFTQSTQLNVHLRSHTGDRPYPCRICGRRFSHSNALILHIRRHTGEKPFQCAMCPLYFSQLPHMKAHMRNIHHKEKAYKCQKCNQFFKLKAHLEKHVTTCVVGDIEKRIAGNIDGPVKSEEIEVESAMSLSRMRYLLALLLTMIATKAKLKYLATILVIVSGNMEITT